MTPKDRLLWEGARRRPEVFAQLVLGAEVMPELHRQLHAHRGAHKDCAVELPRGHGKTTEIGIGELHAVARAAIEQPDKAPPRLKIVVANDVEVKKTGRFMHSIIETEAWQWTFPELSIDPEWNNQTDFRILNTRAKGGLPPLRDPTVEVRAINGRPGGRWDRIWFDDICDLQNSILKPALRAQVASAADNTWMPMRDKASRHRKCSVRTYTPWHHDDKGMMWSRYYAARGALFRRPVIDFRSPWPEAFDEEYLRNQREEIGPTAYARAYELTPASEDQLIFKPQWLMDSSYVTLPRTVEQEGECIIALDFAYSERRITKPDPDWSVCLCALIDQKGHVWVTEMIRMRCAFPEFMDAVGRLVERRRVRRGIGEAVAGQIGLVQQATRDLGIPIAPKSRVSDKITRATVSQAQVARGEFHLPRESLGDIVGSLRPVYEEMVGFPVAAHDDCVDPAVDLLDEARAIKPRRVKRQPDLKDRAPAFEAIRSRIADSYAMRGPG